MSFPLLSTCRGLICAALSILALPAHGNVLVVDAAGGPFTSIQAAVDAARPGDTVLIKTGTYSTFLVNAKPLTVVGDENADVQIAGAVRVRSLPAGGLVVLSNLTATGVPGSPPQCYGLYLSDNQGAVRARACFFTGAAGAGGAQLDGADGVFSELSPDVALVRCGIFGGQGLSGWEDDTGISGAGANLASSTVALYDCVLEGGDGQNGVANAPDAGHGGSGCKAQQAVLFASNTVFYGGDGGQGANPAFSLFSIGGDGGHGVQLGTGALARVLDIVATGGPGGIGWIGIQPNGPHGTAGQARFGAPSQFVDIAGTARELETARVVREGATLTLTLKGEPGDRVGLFLGPMTNHAFLGNLRGVLLVQTTHPALALYVGEVPAGGVLSVAVPVGSLPAAVESRVGQMQPIFWDLFGRKRLGSAVSVVVLDSIF